MITVRPVAPSDSEVWLTLRRMLWPEPGGDHLPEIRRFFAGELQMPLAVLVAEESERGIVGFAELSIRAYAEGCSTNNVGFLEGWFVVPDARRRGIGRALVSAAEDWARAQGCTEFASDAIFDNTASAVAHQALGFEEVEIIRCFRKDLGRITPSF